MNENLKINSYRELIVWQKSMKLVISIYGLTKQFPKSELYGLTSQMQRSAISIPSNIAEGKHRGTRKDFTQFLRIAFASGAELETQIEIAKQLNYCMTLDYKEPENLLSEVMKMLNVMINKMSENQKN